MEFLTRWEANMDESVSPYNLSTREIDLVALRYLLRNSYWQRVWIRQEVAVASRVRVYCGAHIIKWEILVDYRQRIEKSVACDRDSEKEIEASHDALRKRSESGKVNPSRSSPMLVMGR
jgi:hypothetical protein